MKTVRETMWAWIRGLVWTAMIFGCAWASAQSYLVAPAAGHYHAVAMGEGVGVGMGHGVGVEGAQNAEALPKDELFANTEVFAKNATHVTEITMDPDTLSMVGGPDKHKAHNMVLNVVRTYQYDKPGMYNMADVDALRNKLNTGDWHCSVHTRDLKTGEGSDICGKRRTDGMRESAIIEVEPKQLTFIHTIRRGGGPGDSELGYFPMLPGLSGLPAMAMMDPEAFADMQIGLHGLPMMLNVPGAHVYRLSPEMKGKMDELQKQLKVRPFRPEEMQKFKDQSQKFRDQTKIFKLDAPDEDAAPPAAAPAPTAPQVAPVPATPQSPQ